ncbi:thermonuclease family protein [Chitinolyticbacter meiyuanensis]|uniref:thermonuclease family protein n=1 Tax=Chitinolyticbacter meiyuanensis TaxID=682798 RepID=UPI0011E5F712|nr:thermonuclease family protein [Chitinolyticbacter meiyuanensis]
MLRWLCLTCLLLAGCLDVDFPRSEPSRGELLQGRVIGVADGDTLTLLDAQLVEHRLRLAFVDAPEKAQAYGSAAKWQLSAEVYGREVRAEVVDVDRYGRGVARVWRGAEDVNLALLRRGLAWHYTRYAEDKQPGEDFDHYAAAERNARSQGLGLWQGRQPLPPWQYRQRQRAGH